MKVRSTRWRTRALAVVLPWDGTDDLMLAELPRIAALLSLHLVRLGPMGGVLMSTESGTAGRVVRAALIIFPFGLVLLGAGSFVFYFNHKEQSEQRAIKYAAGLRKDLNEADIARYTQVFDEALGKPEPERSKTVTSFVESTLGPENMGYTVRAVRDRNDPVAVPLAFEVEATGARKPRDLVVVVTELLPDLAVLDNASISRSAAVFLNVAHSLAGQSRARSIRFVSVTKVAALRAYYEQAIGNEDRISHVLLLGRLSGIPDETVNDALHLRGRGTVLLRPTVDAANVMDSATKLLKQITDLADRL